MGVVQDSIKIHVVSPTKVEVVGELNGHGQRPCFAEVRAVVDSLNLESYLDQESMIIMLQSHFEENDDRNIILKVVSNLRDESIHQQTDDGVSQSVQINSGVASFDSPLQAYEWLAPRLEKYVNEKRWNQ